jgi:hypothetical protein
MSSAKTGNEKTDDTATIASASFFIDFPLPGGSLKEINTIDVPFE